MVVASTVLCALAVARRRYAAARITVIPVLSLVETVILNGKIDKTV